MEENEVNEHGRFWLAEEPIEDGRMTPANAVGGTLKIDAHGEITLQREPMLLPDSGIPSAWTEGSIILGYLPRTERFVRLEQLEGIYPLVARFCLIGPSPLAGLMPIDDCTNIQVPLDGFDEWFGLIWPKPEQNEDGEIIVKSGPPRKWAYELPTIDADIEIRFDWLVRGHQAARTLSGRGAIGLQPRVPRTLHEIADIVSKLEDLLRLLTDRDRSFGWPQVKRQGDDDWSRFYYYFRSRRGQSEIKLYESWVLLSWIEKQFGAIADSWFAKYKDFATTFNNYLATRRGSALYLEHQFASLVWAMEAMSRRSEKPRTDCELLKKITQFQQHIKSHLSARDRRKLKHALRYAAHPNLEDRLFEILRSLPLGLKEEHLRAFSNNCVKLRNDLSHYGGPQHGTDTAAPDSNFTNDLIKFTRALDLLCHAKILQEIGVPDEILRRPFQFDRRRWLLKEAGLQPPDLTSEAERTSSGGPGD